MLPDLIVLLNGSFKVKPVGNSMYIVTNLSNGYTYKGQFTIFRIDQGYTFFKREWNNANK